MDIHLDGRAILSVLLPGLPGRQHPLALVQQRGIVVVGHPVQANRMRRIERVCIALPHPVLIGGGNGTAALAKGVVVRPGGRHALGVLQAHFIPGVPVVAFQTGVRPDSGYQRLFRFQRQLGALRGVVLVQGHDPGLRQGTAHLGSVSFHLGFLVLVGQIIEPFLCLLAEQRCFCAAHNCVQSFSLKLFLLILQRGLPGADGLVGLLLGLAAHPGEPLCLGLEALGPLLVVALAVGGVHFGLRVGQGGGEAGEGPGHLVHGSRVLLQPLLDDGHRLGAGDGALGDHVVDLALAHTQAPGQHTDDVHAPLLEHVEVFQAGLVAGLHPAQGLGHDGHVGGADTYGAAGVADALHQLQHPFRI